MGERGPHARFAETFRRAAAEGLVLDAPAPQALPKPYEVPRWAVVTLKCHCESASQVTVQDMAGLNLSSFLTLFWSV